jgi:uncharacterized membrane protein YuzA (DUF378 family)
MRIVYTIAFILVIIGALNWGLVGIANIDLVQLVTGGSGSLASGYASSLGKVVYSLVGIAGLIAVTHIGRNEAE